MDYRIDDELAMLRAALREFLEARMPDLIREPARDNRATAWRELVSAGWLEHFGAATGETGAPADWVGGVHVAEAFGAVPVPGPVDVVAGYLMPLAKAAGMSGLLERLHTGSVITAAPPVPDISGRDGVPQWRHRRLCAVREANRIRVSGVLARVPAAGDAQAVVVPVDLDGVPGLALVGCDQAGVEVGVSAGVDLRRPVADVRLRRTRLEAEALYTDPGLSALEERCATLYSLFLDAEAVGGGAEVIARSVDYCTTRTQFGRPIGAFQAIRHRLADAASGVEGARSLVYQAAWNVAAGAPGAMCDVRASRLWAAGGDPAAAAGGRPGGWGVGGPRPWGAGGPTRGPPVAAIQCHGGMGFTWDQRLHLWYRAAVAGRGADTVVGARSALAALLRGDERLVPSAPHGRLAAAGRTSK
ncbi:acyl-CoA dehydrogenase family protein [Mycobacterium adipatum]|uniref:acyl-CoA dehydrogenase family protein n=1 Tax=Mycobacterium adipatum TaxID=1682113 RepID=UPI0034E087E6